MKIIEFRPQFEQYWEVMSAESNDLRRTILDRMAASARGERSRV
jgi:hypothetical protein